MAENNTTTVTSKVKMESARLLPGAFFCAF